MARTFEVIKKSIGADFVSNPKLTAMYDLNPSLSFEEQFSSVSLESLIIDVIAFAIWLLESLFDTHKSEVKAIIDKEKKGSRLWYSEIAKKYQHGDTLVVDQDYYDNSALTDAEIEARRVVKASYCIETGTGLRIKLAGITAGSLAPLTGAQLLGFQAYMHKIKIAGTFISYVNNVADSLKLTYDIYYDAQILDATGKRLDGSNDTPVQNAIADYLTNRIEFNGYFITSALTDLLQKVEGVVIPSNKVAQARYGMIPFADINDFYQPDAGYLTLSPADLTLNFIPINL